MSELAKRLAGKFIVIDGPDGAGKTTQLTRLRDHLTEIGVSLEVAIDPGTTTIGQKIRGLLLDRETGEIAPACETLLFMASRAQLVQELIRPAVEAGGTVLCDRFITATIAYQGASGVDRQTILRLGEIATAGLWPHLTLVLDLPVDVGFQRLGLRRSRLKQPTQEEMAELRGTSKRSRKPKPPSTQLSLFGDRLEGRSPSYHQRVREIFKELAGDYPAPVRYVDATGDEAQVFCLMLEAIEDEFLG